jgi:hypothetical protein
MAIGMAVWAGSSARGLLAQTYTFQQNANGQGYSYTAPDGHIITGNFPTDNNWSQSVTDGSYNYPVNQTFMYEDAPSNWSPTPALGAYPNGTSDDIIIPGLPVTLDVSVSIHNLTINTSGGVSMLPGTTFNIVGPSSINNGQILVNNGSNSVATTLDLGSGTLSGTGLISAIGGATQINLAGTTLSGQTLNTSAGAYVYLSSSPVTFSNLTSNAQVDIPAASTLNVTGNLTDNGQFLVNSGSNNATTILNFSGGTVSGTGSLVLNSSNTTAQLNGALTQSAGHSILGYGQINAALTNNGTVNANTSGQTLYLQTSNMTNNSLFTASGGGTLYISGITVTQGASGLISVGSGSSVLLNSVGVLGGTLNCSAGTAITTVNNTTNLFSSITNNAQINLTAGTTINVTGNLTDNGQFLVNSGSNNATTILNFSGGTVSGTGSLVLNSSNTTAQLNGALNQSAGHSILGYGQINAALTNNGTVNANVSGQTLALQTSNMTNNSLFEATVGGTLYINGITVNQSTGGLISASGSGSVINLNGATISGGTLNTSGGAYVYQNGSADTFASLTSNAQVNMSAGTTINATGNLVDNGQILVNTGSNNATTILNISGGTVSGTGSFVLNGSNATAQLNGSLTQSAGHSILGYGQINAALTNNGTVNANVNGQTLVLQTSNMSNNATLTSANGGTLEVSGITLTQGAAGVINAGVSSGINFTNTTVNGGVITAANGSTATVNTSVLSGTTFNSAAGATVVVQGGISSIGSVMQNSAGSVVDINAGATLNITGSLVDNGKFVVNSQSNNATTILNFSGGTITGSGSFILNSGTTTAQLNGTLTQPAGHSILGYGQINAALTNNGTVNANTSGQTLYLQTSNMTNNSLFTASGGGTLYISGITVTQGASGLISVGSGSSVLLNSVSVLGGTLNCSTGTAITAVNNTTNLFSSITNNAQINLTAGTTINVMGNLTDNGQFLVNSGSNNATTILNFSGGTVTGTGSLVLNSSNTTAQLNGALTQSAGHSILGYGQINAALTNNGTVNANVNGQTLALQTSNMTNNSLFEATVGGTLYINGITVNQSTGGLISASGSGSVINLNGATISGGTLNTSGGAYVYQNGSADTFASLTSNAQVNMSAGTTINATGNLVDNGQILVNSGSNNATTILNVSGGTVSGTGSFVLNGSNATAQLNGSLTQSAGHSILGFGQINAALTNNGTVNANVNGQTLALNGVSSGTGNYQVSGGGTLNVAANLTINSPGSLVGAGAGSTILINSGVSLIENGSISGLPAITDNGILTIAANPNTGILTRSINALTLGSTGTATITAASNLSNRTLLVTSGLTFAGGTNAWGGQLNLGNNDMDVSAGSLANITNQIKQGYNSGNWQGSAGIVSSAAASATNHLFALGTIQNNQSGSALFTATHLFDGTVPGAGDVLVKYTYYGDANLSGKVDSADYSLIDNGYLSHLTGWFNGDFNYDGVINGSDYTLIDNAFNQQGAVIASEIAVPTAEIAAPVSSVPEPGVLTTLLFGVAPLLGRRRNRRSIAISD